jgi:ribosome-associated protein
MKSASSKAVVSPPSERAEKIAAIASEGKAEEIVLLDLRGLSNVTDYFVIFSGTSSTHLRSLGKRIEDELHKAGVKPASVDGSRGTGWMVYDYGNVIVHAMLPEVRRSFDLERLWGDAPRTDWE